MKKTHQEILLKQSLIIIDVSTRALHTQRSAAIRIYRKLVRSIERGKNSRARGVVASRALTRRMQLLRSLRWSAQLSQHIFFLLLERGVGRAKDYKG